MSARSFEKRARVGVPGFFASAQFWVAVLEVEGANAPAFADCLRSAQSGLIAPGPKRLGGYGGALTPVICLSHPRQQQGKEGNNKPLSVLRGTSSAALIACHRPDGPGIITMLRQVGNKMPTLILSTLADCRNRPEAILH
jgi:hypothetical protein